jgi:hypothetical protein
MSRLAATPAQLQRFLRILSPHGFTPKRVELSPDGSIILHGESDGPLAEPDPLAEWESKRARRLH